MIKFPFARVAQGTAVLIAALASVATSDPNSSFVGNEGGAPATGFVSLTQGSPSSTFDYVLTGLDAASPVVLLSPADPTDPKLTPTGTSPFPPGFVTVTLLSPNGGSPAGKSLDVAPNAPDGSSITTFAIPAADPVGRGCLCPASATPVCGEGADASVADDAGSAQDDASSTATDAGVLSTDAGCGTAPDAGCDTCNARIRLTFLLPSGFTSLNVGYNLSLAQGTVTPQ